ncbi:MAG: AEC family transporter [Aquificaceae bacterium]
MLDVFLLLLLAYILRSFGFFEKEHAKVFVNYVVYLSLPALSFKSAHNLGLSWDVVKIALVAWGSIISCLVISFPLGRALGLKGETLRSFMLSSSFGNTAFLGYPYTLSYFGQEGLKYAVIYDSLGSFLMVSSVGVMLSRGSINLKEVFLFPPFLGLLFGFLLRDFAIPKPLESFIDLFSASLSPVVLFAMGISISLSGINRRLKSIVPAILIKMGFSEIVAYLLCFLLRVENLPFKVSVLQASMPTMVMAGVLSLRYGLDYDLAFASAGLGLLLSFFIVPTLLHFII